MQHCWRQSIRLHRTHVSDTQIQQLALLWAPLLVRVCTLIHNYALLQCLKQLELLRTTSCSGKFTRTTTCLPRVHRLRTTHHFKVTDFHSHWWVTRTDAPPICDPVPFDPATTSQRRAERGQQRRRGESHARGRAPSNTRRHSLVFERVPPSQHV